MPQVLQQLDLANGRDREPVLLRLHPDPLQRDERARLDVLRLEHLAIRPLADLDQSLVQLSRRQCRCGCVGRWCELRFRLRPLRLHFFVLFGRSVSRVARVDDRWGAVDTGIGVPGVRVRVRSVLLWVRFNGWRVRVTLCGIADWGAAVLGRSRVGLRGSFPPSPSCIGEVGRGSSVDEWVAAWGGVVRIDRWRRMRPLSRVDVRSALVGGRSWRGVNGFLRRVGEIGVWRSSSRSWGRGSWFLSRPAGPRGSVSSIVPRFPSVARRRDVGRSLVPPLPSTPGSTVLPVDLLLRLRLDRLDLLPLRPPRRRRDWPAPLLDVHDPPVLDRIGLPRDDELLLLVLVARKELLDLLTPPRARRDPSHLPSADDPDLARPSELDGTPLGSLGRVGRRSLARRADEELLPQRARLRRWHRARSDDRRRRRRDGSRDSLDDARDGSLRRVERPTRLVVVVPSAVPVPRWRRQR